MPPFHALLQRQLKRHLGGAAAITDTWRPLLDAVSAAYEEFDRGRRMLERALELSSSELFQANSELRGVLEALPDVLFRMDAGGEIIDLRQNSDAALGLPLNFPGETAGSPQARFHEAICAVHSTNQMVGFEYSTINGESHRFYETRLLPFLNGGIIGIVRDITTRKQAEDALRASEAELVATNRQLIAANVQLREARQAADAANLAKSDFLANMSHEIRTPMNGVMGMCDVLLATELTADQRESLGLIQLSANALMSIINDILDFSKIEAGKIELERAPFRLRDLVAEACKSVALSAEQKGIELLADVGGSVPDALLGDPTRMRQVLLNLLGNAVKFTSEGEIVLSVVSEDDDGLAGEGPLLHFAVRDTGIGIPEDLQRRIFNRFEQADCSTTRKYGGTGLGLCISQRIVEMMGGRIWLESTPGAGSTFHFTVMVALDTEAPVQPLDETLRGVPVLVVDDNATSRRILGQALARWQVAAQLVDSGAAALAAIAKAAEYGRPFRLLLTNTNMPDMDGLEFLERIRSLPVAERTARVILTLAGRPIEARRCRELSIRSHVSKPVDERELHKALLMALTDETREARHADAIKPESLAPVIGGRILLAEDNVVNQRVAVALLKKLGHKVVVTSDGQEALDCMQHDTFDLIFMDVQMPRMDGFTATKMIRSQEAGTGRHIPIVAMTAHAMKGDRQRCVSAGMDDYVTKPVTQKDLAEAIDRVLTLAQEPEAHSPVAAPERL